VRDLGILLEAGGHKTQTFLGSDLVVLSPGVPLNLEPLNAARQKGIPILGEMGLAAELIDVPMVAVTGTNGKSTVTAFLGTLLDRAGLKVFVGGNIGTPLMDYVMGKERADMLVLEVSSFQLDTMEKFCPVVSIVLNISPDHLDRYPSYEAYVQSKLRICRDQGEGQYAILNDNDEALRGFSPAGSVSVLRYGTQQKRKRQAFVEGLGIRVVWESHDQHFSLERCSLPGRHNQENLMACVLAGLALDLSPQVIQETIEQFRGLPHRLEWVRRIRDIDFYDDSKATNVDAAVKSVGSFGRPVILIAGGRHKGGDYAPLLAASRGKVRKAVLLGESRDLLARAFEKAIPCQFASDMGNAVSLAFASARPKDVVLLAPACSSFDMFSDYAHRGRVFSEAVKRLANGK
jgi:UDP-N-acetylmuramoylalanine--D-glutamate ligase